MASTTTPAMQADAIRRLREHFPVASKVHTIVTHVARSGMSRAVAVYAIDGDDIFDVSYLVARALKRNLNGTHGGVTLKGAGMDMAFALVFDLSRTLHPTYGMDVIPRRDAGYALRKISL